MNSSIDAHQLLETLSTQPIASAGFPSHFSIAIQIRNAITNEKMSLKNISEIVRKDPLVATKVVRTANSALFAGTATLTDIERSINRIGLDAVKTDRAGCDHASADSLQRHAGLWRLFPKDLAAFHVHGLCGQYPHPTRNPL